MLLLHLSYILGCYWMVLHVHCVEELLEGDILPDNLQRRIRRSLQTKQTEDYLWIDGIVKYEMEDRIEPQAKNIILKAMKHIEKLTCIRFHAKERSDDDDYIEFIRAIGCYSNVGRQGGRQIISIGYGCEYKHVLVHELLHALGMHHENTRVDSGLYLNVLWWNIQSGAERNFQSNYHKDSINSLKYPYDYYSVTHYENKDFSKNGDNTLEAIDDPKKILGNHLGLSKTDVRKINDAYKCNSRKKTECRDKYKYCKEHQRYCKFKWFGKNYCQQTCNGCR